MKIFVFFVLLLLCSCSQQSGWQMRALPEESAISTSLTTSPDITQIANLTLEGFPYIEIPKHIRPCCAFGDGQRVSLGKLTIPFFQYSNTLSLANLGAHSYDAGTISLKKKSPNSRRERERNGLIYTLRGGFLDVAHIRDTADNTIGLFYQIFPLLGQNAKIQIPTELGARYIQLNQFEVDQYDARERWKIAAHIAAYLSFVMAQAHEIAQWHGYRSWPSWPETISAFSPEDLYSNMLGAKIALSLLLNNLALTQELYEQHFSTWLYKTIDSLHPLSKQQTTQLFQMLDGHWWDSSISMPNKYMIIKRDYHIGTHRLPLLVPDAFITQLNVNHQLLNIVPKKAVALNLSTQVLQLNIKELGHMVLNIDKQYKASFIHIPASIWQNGFTNDAFEVIAQFDKDFDNAQINKADD